MNMLEVASSDTPRGERLRRRVIKPMALCLLAASLVRGLVEVGDIGQHDYGCAQTNITSGDTTIQAALRAKDQLGAPNSDSLESALTYEAQQSGAGQVGDTIQACVTHAPLRLANLGDAGWAANVTIISKPQN